MGFDVCKSRANLERSWILRHRDGPVDGRPLPLGDARIKLHVLDGRRRLESVDLAELEVPNIRGDLILFNRLESFLLLGTEHIFDRVQLGERDIAATIESTRACDEVRGLDVFINVTLDDDRGGASIRDCRALNCNWHSKRDGCRSAGRGEESGSACEMQVNQLCATHAIAAATKVV